MDNGWIVWATALWCFGCGTDSEGPARQRPETEMAPGGSDNIGVDINCDDVAGRSHQPGHQRRLVTGAGANL